MNATSRRTMCQNAAFRLQRECYERQTAKPARKTHQFTPCPKGLIYSNELGQAEPRPMSLLWNEVVLTPCSCHTGFTVNDCIEYEHDSTYNPYVTA